MPSKRLLKQQEGLDHIGLSSRAQSANMNIRMQMGQINTLPVLAGQLALESFNLCRYSGSNIGEFILRKYVALRLSNWGPGCVVEKYLKGHCQG